MSTADLTPHDIADGANGALTMGQVSMIDTADVVPNMANGVNLSAKLTVTSFETASIVQKGGNYR